MRADEPRFLVTAGNTRERIDEVRDWGNIFTGATGFDIARSLMRLGPVELLTSNAAHVEWARQHGGDRLTASRFGSHAELRAALASRMTRQSFQGVFMTAAVCDYKPSRSFEVVERTIDPVDGSELWRVRDVQAGKVKSCYQHLAVLGERTEKIVDLFRTQWGHDGLLVKFKLEVGIAAEHLLEIARESRRASGADYLVANTLEMVRGERPGAYIVSGAGETWVSRGDLAQRLTELAEEHVASLPSGVASATVR